MTAYNIYLFGKLIDTVYFQKGVDAAYVVKSLIEHDGYDPQIRAVAVRNLQYNRAKGVIYMSKQPKRYVITHVRPLSGRQYSSQPLTIDEAVKYYSYTLEVGASCSTNAVTKRLTAIRLLLRA